MKVFNNFGRAIIAGMICASICVASSTAGEVKTETFDRDPQWWWRLAERANVEVHDWDIAC